MTPLEQKYSCERSELALYEASDSDGGAKEVRTTGEPKHYIRLNENRSWKLM